MSAERFRLWVSTVLVVGVSLSAVLVAIGFLTGLAIGWTDSLVGAPPNTVVPTDFSGVFAGLAAGRPVAIAQLGLLVLVATPVIRVGVSLIAFVVERDRLYVAITASVLGLLLLSLFLVR
jgi:uncharacterized membrane protein